MTETLDRFHHINILFNNAGINIRKPPQELAIEEWRQVIDTNLSSAFLMSKAVYPAMKRAGGGKIINIGQHDVAFRIELRRGLRNQQGRDCPAHQEPGPGLGRRQHPGQRDLAGLV